MLARTSRGFARPAAVLALAAGLAVAADPPAVAPPPREAKPAKAKVDPKLLVGKWQIIAQSYQPIPPGLTKTMEFTRDGRYRFEVLSTQEPPWHQTGSYALQDDGLTLQSDQAALDPKLTRTVTVVSLTNDRLDLSGQGANDHHQHVLARLPAK